MPRSIALLLSLAATLMTAAERVAADILTLQSGEIISGELVSETPDEVVFHGKIAGIWSKARFDRARVASVKREPGDQGPASERGPTPPPDKPAAPAPDSSPKPNRGAAPIPGPAPTDSPSTAPEADVVEVMVQGTGATPKEAFDDAIRAALVQVAGTFIRSESKVEDDRIVQDRVIAHAQGFVERAERKGNARLQGGAYVQDAIVLVRVSKVGAALAGGAEAGADVDGESLYARVRSMRERNATRSELLEALFEGFPANVLKCEVAEGPVEYNGSRLQGVRLDGGQIVVLVKVDVWVDMDKWRAWCQCAQEVLKATSVVRSSVNWNPKKAGAARVSQKTNVGPWFIKAFSAWLSDKAAESEHLLVKSDNSRDMVKELLQLDTERQDAGGEESLREGLVTQRNLRYVAILSQPGGKLDVFGFPLDALAGAGMPWGVPELLVELQDADGNAIGTTVRAEFKNDGSGHSSLSGSGASHWCEFGDPYGGSVMSASLAFTNGLWGKGFILMPLLRCNDRDRSVPIVSSRVTFPCTFVMSADELLAAARVSAKLGKVGPMRCKSNDFSLEGR